MLPNRSIPRCTVIPEIPYDDVGEALEWITKAFGFTLRIRVANHRAQMNAEHCAVVLVEKSAVGGPASVLVRVTNVDEHCKRARQHGAKIVSEPTNFPYGERQYTALDPGGNRWTFSQTISDVDPAAWGGTPGLL